jgi:hypothetical protein
MKYLIALFALTALVALHTLFLAVVSTSTEEPTPEEKCEWLGVCE